MQCSTFQHDWDTLNITTRGFDILSKHSVTKMSCFCIYVIFITTILHLLEILEAFYSQVLFAFTQIPRALSPSLLQASVQHVQHCLQFIRLVTKCVICCQLVNQGSVVRGNYRPSVSPTGASNRENASAWNHYIYILGVVTKLATSLI